MTYKKILIAVKSKAITIDVAFEELSKLGYCPNLLNDDNGRWAVSFEGYQSVPDDEPSDIDTSFFVEAKYWKNSIYEALIYSLEKQD